MSDIPTDLSSIKAQVSTSHSCRPTPVRRDIPQHTQRCASFSLSSSATPISPKFCRNLPSLSSHHPRVFTLHLCSLLYHLPQRHKEGNITQPPPPLSLNSRVTALTSPPQPSSGLQSPAADHSSHQTHSLNHKLSQIFT